MDRFVLRLIVTQTRMRLELDVSSAMTRRRWPLLELSRAMAERGRDAVGVASARSRSAAPCHNS